MSGEFAIRGFRNKDLRKKLIEQSFFALEVVDDQDKIANITTRLLGKLRAHGLIMKLKNTCRYRVTKRAEILLSRIVMFSKFELKTC